MLLHAPPEGGSKLTTTHRRGEETEGFSCSLGEAFRALNELTESQFLEDRPLAIDFFLVALFLLL
jgi:hypothetical protein